MASRKRAALGIAGLSWLLGLLSVLSLNLWSGVRILDRDIMTFIEFIANDLMLPLGGLLIALFAGWALNRTIRTTAFIFMLVIGGQIFGFFLSASRIPIELGATVKGDLSVLKAVVENKGASPGMRDLALDAVLIGETADAPAILTRVLGRGATGKIVLKP